MKFGEDFDRMKAFCEGPFKDLCTPAEIAEAFNLDESTIRYAIKSEKLIQGEDCFKFGKQWVLTKSAFPKIAKFGGWTEYSELRCKFNKMLDERGLR